MKRILIVLFAGAFVVGCSNATTTTTVDKTDSVVKNDTTKRTEPNGNAVTPPASNGQY